MPQLYKRTNLEKSSQSVAFLMDQIIASGEIEKIQKEISSDPVISTDLDSWL